MNFKNLFNSLFSYKPSNDSNHKFNLIEDAHIRNYPNSDIGKKDTDTKKIFTSLDVNLEYVKTKYNLLINSDIVLRQFTLNARGKQYNAFLLYIDGMINSELMDNFVLKPLMMRNRNNLYDGGQNKVVSQAVANNITVRKVKKFDLPSYIINCLLPQNTVKQAKTFEQAFTGINSRKLCTFYRYFRFSF